MAGTLTKGNCYICGSTLSKSAFKKHILAAHAYDGADAQDCSLLKVESVEDKNYWIYLDIPMTSTLKSLDGFLREIWLECCGHMSAFYTKRYEQVGMGQKIGAVSTLGSLRYEYDFGSTTELLITFAGTIKRSKQRKAIRLIGRNEPYRFLCAKCGKEADFICCECMWEDASPFFCESCMEKHRHDSVLPITNSPRMGICAYSGELDNYEFDVSQYPSHK